MKVFYVDDERFNLLLFRKSMPATWEIQLFAKPSELLEKIESEIPDVVISDEHMEEMFGSKMIQKIHAKYPGIFKIIITGKVDIDYLKTQVQAGQISYFLGKPYDPNHLIKIVEDRFPLSKKRSALGPNINATEAEKEAVFEKAHFAFTEYQKVKLRAEKAESSLQDALLDLSMQIHLKIDPSIITAIAESVFDKGGSYSDFQNLIWKFAKTEKGS